MVTVDIIAPVYNEEDCILEFIQVVATKILSLDEFSRLILIDDGSTDRSWDLMQNAAQYDPRIILIRFTKNYGHQRAVLAGLKASDSRFVAIIDSDLQDDPCHLPSMLEVLIREGAEVVYGQRISREGESWFKKVSASAFYRLLNKVTKVQIPLDSGDFRIVTRKAVDAVICLEEANPFLRGQFASTGLLAIPYPYDRNARHAGETKYNLRKMFGLAINAFLSLSDFPLKIAVRLSLIGFLFVGIFFIYAFVIFLNDSAVAGWASVFFLISFFGSATLLILSFMSYYMAEIWRNSVRVPNYVIAEVINEDIEHD
jgi:glycosyltransferase involved in cell wall biosynthesis